MVREESFFDELARGLADGSVTRAKAIRLMGGALVGAALASVPGVAWANDRCSEGQTRCGDRCVNLQTNERHCGSCRNRCASTQTCCGGRCVNLKRSERHCGSCSNRCAEGQECVEGVCSGGEPICTPSCPEGEVCTQGQPGTVPFCDPICTPSCLEGCDCQRSGDGSGNVCTGFVGGPIPTVSSCDQCPTAEFPEFTVCVDIAPAPDAVFLTCQPPC
jgi:Stigma-specific protein, Stig1